MNRMRTTIDSNEVKRILEMHSKLKKNVLSEQNTVAGNVTPVVNQDAMDYKLLQDAEKATCLKNGKIRFVKGTKKPVYVTTTIKTNRIVEFFPDMTYKFSDTGETGKWKCSKAELAAKEAEQQAVKKQQSAQSLSDAQAKKQAYIDKFTAQPYNYILNVSDIDKQKFTELDPVNDLKIPVGVFAVTDKFYSDPSKNKEIKRSSDSTFNDVLENQSIERGACRKNIEDYYKAYKRKNSIVIDGPTFDKAKRIVQACKDEHYGKWGVLGGGMARGMNWDKVLDIMSGGSGGPLTYGEDSKWKLK